MVLTDAWGRSNAGHKEVQGCERGSEFVCLMCLSGCQFVCGLWPRVGRRPPGIYPSRLCLFCVELSAALRMTPSTDSNPPFPSTRRILDQLLTRGPLGRPLTPTNGTLYPSIHRGQAAFGAVLVWRKRAVLCPEVERSAVLVPRASRDDHRHCSCRSEPLPFRVAYVHFAEGCSSVSRRTVMPSAAARLSTTSRGLPKE